MYLLYAEDRATLLERSRSFHENMEPLLRRLEAAQADKATPENLPEITQYLQVCRWPFRQLEYAFALDALLAHLQPGDRFLDAGAGVTPLAHVLAERGVRATACDTDGRLMTTLDRCGMDAIYGTNVKYEQQDLTAVSYPDATFDAVSCISVLEHIPAPADQQAVRELLRILKPGGFLIMTVDFTPLESAERLNLWRYYAQRAGRLARRGDLRAIGQAMRRKIQARQVVSAGASRQPRSANECFQVAHLEQDIAPLWNGHEVASQLPFSTDLRSLNAADARRFWEMEAGLYENQGRRAVLPVAWLLRKDASGSLPEQALLSA